MQMDSYRNERSRALRILICDDRETDRKAVRYALDRSGLVCTYTEASTISDAIEVCQKQSFDCVFVDNMSSSGNGLEGVSILIGKWPFVPVIMITASGDEKIAVDAIQRGAANYFRKGDLTGDSIRQGVEDALTMSSLRQAAMEHVRELEGFASVLVHDLNAPVASLQLYAHALEQDLGSAAVDREALIALCREVVDAGVRTANMIDMLHSYTRSDRAFELRTVDLNAVVSDAKDNLAHLIRSRGAEITWDELPKVAGNAPFLVELIQNLFANAIKYCEGGTPAVHVSASPGPRDNWLVLVSDNGIGIALDQLELVFEPLKRLHDETKYQGSGLGLAISRKIVERHGGTIHALANETGQGSSFMFTLLDANAENFVKPSAAQSGEAAVVALAAGETGFDLPRTAVDELEYSFLDRSELRETDRSDAPANDAINLLSRVVTETPARDDPDFDAASGWSEIPATRRSEGAPKLLIADDDPGMVRFLTGRCVQLGFEVTSAGNGLQALALARRFKPDVLIVDINMPGTDGMSVLKRLLSPGKHPMESIVITASSYAESAERCESLGAIYVRKGKNTFDVVRSALLTMFPELQCKEIVGKVSDYARVENWLLPRVLIVGEDRALDTLLHNRLRNYHIETINVPDRVQGFYRAVSEEPCVIITKFEMRNGDARYLLHKLRARPETANLPVFVISDRVVNETTQTRMRHCAHGPSGAIHFFTQPLHTEQFFDTLGKYCVLANNPNPPENMTERLV